MKRKYPWEEWFSKRRTVILRGVHYRCSQSTMAQTIRNNASQRRLRGVKVTDTDTEIIIEVADGKETRSNDKDSNKENILPGVRGSMHEAQFASSS